jgi:hypothetical protein
MEHNIDNERVQERSGNGSKKHKKSLLDNYTCFGGDQQWSIKDGAQPTVTCSLMPPPPPIPLAKKVCIIQLSLSLYAYISKLCYK